MKKKETLPWFTIQWHVTPKCDQACRHCYLVNDRDLYEREMRNQLSFPDCQRIIDSFCVFCETAEAKPSLYFTGGDPLLRSDFFDILEYAGSRGVKLKVMGNPFHLDRETVERLLELGVKSYQLSIDGMEKIHDWFRKEGSFRATVEGVKLLKDCGMKTVIMFTLSKANASDLSKVMSLVSDLGVDIFAFARLAQRPEKRFQKMFSPLEYRKFLIGLQEHMEKLSLEGSQTFFNCKDHLWKLLWFEQGKWEPQPNPLNQIVTGCHVGGANLAILSDGTVFACRRFNSPVGKVPEQSIIEVYLSKKLDYYRNPKKFKKCSSCPLLYYCRGCPAVSFAASGGDFYTPDPQCWREA